MSSNTQWQIGSDGTLESYPDPFRSVTPEQITRAETLEAHIAQGKLLIEMTFLELANSFDEFEHEKLYLARGHETFNEWVDASVDLSRRTVHDLIRIARELFPLAQAAGVLSQAAQLGVAKMRALLPVLADEGGKETATALIPELLAMPVRDAERHIREARGVDKPIDVATPAIFRATLRRGDSFHTVKIICSDGLDYYDVGTVRIKPKHWNRWSERFGAFIETLSETD